jgi:hypothetical protein
MKMAAKAKAKKAKAGPERAMKALDEAQNKSGKLTIMPDVYVC